jgi:hypothetical protein
MPLATPTQFLNLDLVLKSSSGLSEVIKHFDEKALVLSHHEYNGEWTLVLELAEEELGHNPSQYTERFLAIIAEFPDDIRDVWKACTSRTFAYGFDGGSNSPALETAISADLLLQIGQVGADIGITVYPFRQPS